MTSKHIEKEPRPVMLGRRTVTFPSPDLMPLVDATPLVDDLPKLKALFEELGYLFIRGLHDRDQVLAAREAVLKHLDASPGDAAGAVLDASHPLGDGVLRKGCGVGCVPPMEGKNDITHCPEVKQVLEGERPFKFFKRFFGEDVTTFDYKWLRAVPHDTFTGAHLDSVYMSRGSPRLMTMWTPLGDTNAEMGVIAVVEASHRLDSYARLRDTYGAMDAEKAGLKGSGWFTEDPWEMTTKFGGQWKTADFRAGDVILFGMSTAHMSTINTTNFARISCDTRWQPLSEPCDPRYKGDAVGASAKFGLYTPDGDKKGPKTDAANVTTTIEEMKASWGLS